MLIDVYCSCQINVIINEKERPKIREFVLNSKDTETCTDINMLLLLPAHPQLQATMSSCLDSMVLQLYILGKTNQGLFSRVEGQRLQLLRDILVPDREMGGDVGKPPSSPGVLTPTHQAPRQTNNKQTLPGPQAVRHQAALPYQLQAIQYSLCAVMSCCLMT